MRGVYYSAYSLCYKTIAQFHQKCLLMRDCLLFRRLLLPESTVVHQAFQSSNSSGMTFTNFELFIFIQICLLLHSTLMASVINIGKIIRGEKKIKAMVNIDFLITIFDEVPFDFFFYETPVNPKK